MAQEMPEASLSKSHLLSEMFRRRTVSNAFKITPGGAIPKIIDATGDGTNALSGLHDIAVDSSRNVYVAGGNVFKITPGGMITEIIGDGGNTLSAAGSIAVGPMDNVYVTGFFSNNAIKITTPGTCSTGGTPCMITEIIDSTGDQ